MRALFVLLLLLATELFAQVNCGPHHIRVWSQGVGYSCMPRAAFPPSYDPYGCFSHNSVAPPSGFNTFYGPSSRGGNSAWWAAPARMYYPNVDYPGPWAYPNIQSQHYPGQGEVFAAKPNVYIQSVHDSKDFEFKFTSEGRLSFLTTTPPLVDNKFWRAKITDKDKFEVGGVNYDYLFYDIRLPKEKMQFSHGACAMREEAIEWMLDDLKEMNFSEIALQDFEEHWRVKIPNYPFYCIYPQYNDTLGQALPVSIDLEQANFTRALYVLVPFAKEPDIEHPHPGVPFPQQDPVVMRPSTKITRENMFREWGVAFLGTD